MVSLTHAVAINEAVHVEHAFPVPIAIAKRVHGE